MAMRLDGQHVLVVGGSSGIGLGIARTAAEAGARVTVAGRSRRRLDAALATLGGTAAGRELDFTDEQAVRRLMAALGRIDHLVLTAASHLPMGPFRDLDAAAFRRGFESKFWGFAHCMRHALAVLRRDGSMVLVTGAAARAAMPGTAGVGAINGALHGMVATLAREVAPVRVNCLSPGVVRTPIYDGMPADARDGLFRGAAARLPVGRVGTPEELGDAALFLMAGGYVTGVILDVDGGVRLA